MPTDFAPSMSAPDMLSSPELGLDGINVKHNALVNKVSHTYQKTVALGLAKLAVQVARSRRSESYLRERRSKTRLPSERAVYAFSERYSVSN